MLRRSRRTPLSQILAVALAVAMPAALGPVPTARADEKPAPTVQPTANGSKPAGGSTYQLTLLTGDVVALHIAPDGRQAAWLVRPATKDAVGREPHIYEQDGEVHVVPVEAEPYLAADLLDERLFNVTYLARNGYDDASRDDLPLLLVPEEGDRPMRAPATPAGTRSVRELPSIGGRSVVADKDRVRSAWTEMRGSRAAAPGTARADLAGPGAIWLNGRVRSSLDKSAAQIGAPTAWKAGYDGSGAKVAVLDSGYDPGHPDLAGRVTESADFTDSGSAVDGNGHGTHVAATVGGSGKASDQKRRGIAPGADLLVGRVLNDSGEGYEDWVVHGMEWAVDQGADVVNMSLGSTSASDGSDPLSRSLDRLSASSDTLFVVASGNIGPEAGSISSPGAASSALTVGAVTKQDEAAWFSGRGPRPGDNAVKPEIVAPGVGIAAARAEGTELGSLLDKNYTAMNGTSMATPHVAGAAAVLAQKNPGWTGEQLKARLTSRATVLADEPIGFQGGGRLNVAAAIGSTLEVDEGALSFGRLTQGGVTVSRTLTYKNPSRRSILLRLSADVDGPAAAGDDVVRLDRRLLVVPARGTARATVSVVPGRAPGGAYSGRVRAQVLTDRSASVHTALGFAVEAPARSVEVEAVDRDGRPATGVVEAWNPDSGVRVRRWLSDGRTTFDLIDGTYTLIAAIEGPDSEITIAGHPELRIGRDTTVSFDARDGEPVEVRTPRRTETGSIDVMWTREVNGATGRSRIAHAWEGERLYAVRSPAARRGDFEFATIWRLVEPVDTEAADPTYTYHLAYTEEDRIPGGRRYDVRQNSLASVVSDYRQSSPRMLRNEMWVAYRDGAVLGNGMGMGRKGPVVRTDYLSTQDVDWQRFGQPAEFANMYWTWSAIEPYAPKRSYRQVWWGPLVAPGIPALAGREEIGNPVARFTDVIRLSIPHYRYGSGTLNGWIQEQMGDSSELTLHRNGELVGTRTWSEAQFTVPGEAAWYDLRLQVHNSTKHWADTSVATDTTWRFKSGRTGDERTVLPLLDLTYDLETGARNEVPAGTSYPLDITTRYQPQAKGPGGFKVTAEVSFDDGATWKRAPVATLSGTGRFRATIPAVDAPGFATVRVVATDSAGNRTTQRIDRAWRIAEAAG